MAKKKGDPGTAEVSPNRGLTNHKVIVTHRTALRQVRKFFINALAVASFFGIFAACGIDNLKVSVILAIPSLIYLGLYVWANNI